MDGSGQAVGREAPGPQPRGEGPQGLAGRGRRADPAGGLATVAGSSTVPPRSVAVPAAPAATSSRPPGRMAQLARTVSGAPSQVPTATPPTSMERRPWRWSRATAASARRLVAPEGGQRVDEVQAEVPEAADAGPGGVAHPRRRAVEPSLEQPRDACEHGGHAEPRRPSRPSRRMPRSRARAGSSRRNSAASAGVRLRATSRATPRGVGGRAGERLLEQGGRPARRGLRGQHGPLVDGAQIDDGIGPADRRLGVARGRAGHGDRDRRRVGVPRRGQPEVGLGGQHPEHVGDVRVAAAEERDVDGHPPRVAPGARIRRRRAEVTARGRSSAPRGGRRARRPRARPRATCGA